MDASPRHHRRHFFGLLLAPLLLLAACTGAPAPTIPPDASTSLAPALTGTPAASAAFPATLGDDEGTTVSLASEPKRIVSLTPAVTETLFRLGAGDRVVGKVEDPNPYPPEADSLPTVAKFGSVDVEKIVALGADLVIAGGNGFNPPDAIAKLRSLKIPVVVVYAPDIDGVFSDIELVGDAIGEPAVARDLAASMRASFDQVQAATAQLDHPRTFYELDATKDIFGPAKGSFLEAMVRIAGGDPITTGSTTAYNIPLEKLVAADPQLILLGDGAYGTTADAVAKRPGWGGMTAVKSGAIRPIDDTLVSRPGPRLVEGLRALAVAIHPDLVLPPEPSAPAPSGGAGGATPAASVVPDPSY
ncbi:MAG TPA: ABC transporter substrate-binding protein [Candidatus Limnocylindrales bacterium]|nr:ABC transporter substrate-binding protein [Candidatus Limnocylindrales bacterium]